MAASGLRKAWIFPGSSAKATIYQKFFSGFFGIRFFYKNGNKKPEILNYKDFR